MSKKEQIADFDHAILQCANRRKR